MISKINAPTDEEIKDMIIKLDEVVQRKNVTRNEVKELIKQIVPTFIDLND